MPARNVRTIDPNLAMKSSQSWVWRLQDIPGSDAECQLDQRDGHADLDRNDAGDEDDSGENCCELDWAHGGLLGVGTTFGRGHQPRRAVGASLIAPAENTYRRGFKVAAGSAGRDCRSDPTSGGSDASTRTTAS